MEAVLPRVATSGTLALADGARVPLDVEADLRFLPRTVLPYHVNALTITALAAPDRGDPVSPSSVLLRRTYYSVGGGFVMAQTNDDPDHPQVTSLATPDAARLTGLPEVSAVHSTNGRWDMIAEIGTRTLEELDQLILKVRNLDGVLASETNLLLSTRRAGRR